MFLVIKPANYKHGQMKQANYKHSSHASTIPGVTAKLLRVTSEFCNSPSALSEGPYLNEILLDEH